MAFNLDKTEELLNVTGLDLMMISSDNLMEVSQILGQVEPLEEAFAPLGSNIPPRIIKAIEDVLKAVIRGQISDVDEALALVGQGISMLQDLARSLPVDAPFKGDVDAWEAAFKGLGSPGESVFSPEGHGLDEEGTEAWPAPAGPEFEKAEPFSPETADETGFSGGGEDADSPDWKLEPDDGLAAKAEEADYSPAPQPTRPRPDQDQPFPSLSVEGFRKEMAAEIEEIQVMLVAAEQKSDPLAALGDLRRKIKSVLGAASLIGHDDIALLAYNAEDLIDYVVGEQVPYSPAITDILLRGCEFALKGLREIQVGGDGQSWFIEPGMYDREDLSNFIDKLWMARQGVLPAQDEDASETASLSAAHIAKPKKIGEILVEQGLISEGELGGLIEAQQKARQIPLGDILVAEQYITEQDLQEALAEQKKNPGRKLGELLVALGKVDYDQIELAVKNQEEKREAKLGEFLVKSKIGAPEKVALALREQKRSEGSRGGQIMAQTVKVETMKLDGLIDLVGELVIAQSLITSNSAISGLKEQKINKDLAHVSRITSELQRNAMSLRMVQIRQTFQKMNRLVRDLAHKFDKNVKFETIGSDTEIDRNMVESIYDPLVHLVRNSLDHGLETPDERLALGKSPQGVVRLKAYHQGGNVVIELSDDGRGLNTEKVLQKAVDQGLVSPGENLSDAAIHALVFHPGFSTAEKVSDVSGRGVGMDVVMTNLKKWNGEVVVTNNPGHGLAVGLRLPITNTLLTKEAILLRVGESIFCLPLEFVSEIVTVPADSIHHHKDQSVFRHRDMVISVINIKGILGLGDSNYGSSGGGDSRAFIILQDKSDSRQSIMADEILGQQKIVIKEFELETFRKLPYFNGLTLLGDGRGVLILDTEKLMSI